MGEIKWTKDQQTIINERGCNLLVSAAAGSGKTAVLVERIFQRIMDPEDPVDIDQFVVVTFTRAAASQMKDRLRDRFESALTLDPHNTHLQRQTALLSAAHISTIHSFCNYVIQNYFHRIGLDPSFRQGTKVEVDLLKNGVWEQILEEEYEEAKEDFIDLADMSIFNRRDADIGKMVFAIYESMMNQPFPEDYLDQMEHFLTSDDPTVWEQSSIMRQVMEIAKRTVDGICVEQARLLDVCTQLDGPHYYMPHIEELGDLLHKLQNTDTYGEWYDILSDLQFMRMNKRKDATVDEAKRVAVKDGCKECKDQLKKLSSELFAYSRDECIEDLKGMSGKLMTLIRLTRRLHVEFTKEKRDRNIVDFHDLEQLALSILLRWDEDAGEYVRTEAACELAMGFVEIMIDEYQDSNKTQDAILHAVSKDGLPGEKPNTFMVGDAKQSIYRFRGGCPKLFAKKLVQYKTGKGELYRRIDLHQNFRSRATVLEGCNDVFRRVMHADIGGVEYDEDARLVPGATFPETNLSVAHNIDVYTLISKQDLEAEAYIMVNQIERMTGDETPLYIYDEGEYRQVRYGDIVILVQAHKQGQQYFDILSQNGIPVVMERTRGFFETREIQMMVSMLQVIDNPHQDIPLAAVLVSPMFCLSEDELATVKSISRDTDLYDALCLYDKADETYDHIRHFLDVLSRLREKLTYATVVEILEDIWDETGVYESVMMMDDGIQRNANMDSLMEQAREFEETKNHGLHPFIRYIEQIKEQTEEIGEVNISGEEEDVVRIMTIHKSKGLEFPVCIIGGMGRILSVPTQSFITICPDVGIAAPVVDNAKRTKKNNLYVTALNHINRIDDTGENIRKLYVAMTRAKEKLILIGCRKNTDTKALTYGQREKMNTFFDMALPAVHNTPEYFKLHVLEREEVARDVEKTIIKEWEDIYSLNNFDTSDCYDKNLEKYMEWMSATEQDTKEPLPVKVSVSDLKVRSMEESDQGDFSILDREDKVDEMPIPDFMKGESEVSAARQGAMYGTIWHQVMATIDISQTDTEAGIRCEIQRLIDTGRLKDTEATLLRTDRLYRFFDSPLGHEVRLADATGRLRREQPFVVGRRACDIFPESTSEDTVLVQGIIDGYYETDDGIVLFDYKTDSLHPGEEQVLIDRYDTQMELYRDALQEITGETVTRCVLYSFSLGEEIDV